MTNVSFRTLEGTVVLSDTARTIVFGSQGGSLDGVNATVETAGEISQRVTATRLVAVGVFALAMKKKKDDRELYLMVDGPLFAFVASVDPSQGLRARQFVAAINTAARGGKVGNNPISKVVPSRVTQQQIQSERREQIGKAFSAQHKSDQALVPYMLLAFIVTVGICLGIGAVVGSWITGLILGLILGAIATMVLFARRVQSNVYKQADSTPGAAAWTLQNNRLRGTWRITPAVVGTVQMDAIHRLVGAPGVVLVAEGAIERITPLVKQYRAKISSLVGATPIFEIFVGNEIGQTPLRNLNATVERLPGKLTVTQISEIDSRLTNRPAPPGR